MRDVETRGIGRSSEAGPFYTQVVGHGGEAVDIHLGERVPFQEVLSLIRSLRMDFRVVELNGDSRQGVRIRIVPRTT